MSRRNLTSLLFVLTVLAAVPLRAATVTGKVEAADGTAIADARIELRRLPANYERVRLLLQGRTATEVLASARSEESGRFVVEAPTAGLYTVVVLAESFLAQEILPLVLTGEHELPTTVLPTDTGCRVEVRDESGAPLAGAWIFARHAGAPTRGWTPATRLLRTGDDGTAVVPRQDGERLVVALFVPDSAYLAERQAETEAVFVVPPASGERQSIEVRDESGVPLAGVAVGLGHLAWPIGLTGSDGHLSFPAPYPAPAEVYLTDAGGRFLRAQLEAPTAPFTLPAPARVTVRVLRQADLRPLGGALTWPAFDPGSFAVADAEGRAVLPVPPLRGAGLRAAAHGFLTASATAEGSEAEILMSAPRRAYGHVVDTEGKAVAAVRVSVRPTGEERRAPVATADTGDDGRFEIPHLEAGRIDLLARRPGYAPTLVRGIEPSWTAAAAADLGTLILERGAALMGRVVDEEGRGIAGTAVWLFEDLRRPAEDLLLRDVEAAPATHTDEDGFFTVADLDRGRRFHLLLRREGYLPAVLEAVEAPPRELPVVVLETGATLGGRLVDEDGAPVAGASIELRPAPPAGRLELPPLGAENRHETTSENDGSYGFDTVATGLFEVTVQAEGFLRPQAREVTVPLEGRVDFVLRRGAVLSGQVRTEDGEPLAGVRILVGDATAASDSEGRYRVSGVPLGRQHVEARHRTLNGAAAEVEVDEGENTHDFVFAAGHTVRGRVVDEMRTPLAGAQVELAQLDWENRRQLQVTADEEGRFELEVADGSYKVRGMKPGYAWAELPDLLVVAGAGVDGVELTLPLGAVVTGHVRGLEPEELLSLEVLAESAGAPTRRDVVDYEGRFEIADLAAGDYVLRSTNADGSREARARLVVEPGVRRLERDLLFGGGYGVEGQVLFGGEPLHGARISVTGYDVALERQVHADHEGGFHFADLPPGHYRLSASHPRQLLMSNKDLTVDGDTQVLIELEAAKVHGNVRSTGGEPLAGVLTLLQQVLEDGQNGSLYTTSTDAEGYFALPQLTAGRYRITLRRDGYEQLAEILDLVAGPAGAPLSFELAPTRGLEMQIALATGGRPPYVTVNVLDEAGHRLSVDRRTLDAEGRVSFPTLGHGTWKVVVSAPGTVAAEETVTVPGEPLALMLAPASRLHLRLPALVESDRIATARLFDAAGRPFKTVSEGGTPAERWELRGGVADVAGVPPGEWTVEVVAGDGQTWRQSLVAAVGGDTQVIVK